MNDQELLQAFARDGSQTAFQELVTRYAPSVYSFARQRVGDAHAAEDIVQSVFLALSMKAGRLSANTVLSGWLYRATRFATAEYLRREQHRREREMKAYEHQEVQGTTDDTAPVWQEIQPHLVPALDNLSAGDREAVLLRFYRQLSFRDVSATLAVSEETAKKRVQRALERLRRFFGKKGVGITIGALATTLGARSVEAMPATLVAQAVQTAVAGTGGATTATGISMVAKGALKMMFMAKLQAAAVGTVAVVAAGTVAVTAVQVTTQTGSSSNKQTKTPGIAAVGAPITPVSSVVRSDLSRNAALQYWMAIYHYTEFPETLKKIVGDKAQDKVDQSFMQQTSRVAGNLHRGALIEECDFGLPYAEEGPGTLLPHLYVLRAFSRLLSMRALYFARNKCPVESIDTLVDGLALSRHLQRHACGMQWLSGISSSRAILDTAGQCLSEFDSTALQQLQERLVPLLPHETIPDMLQVEKLCSLGWLLERTKTIQDDREVVRLFHSLIIGSLADPSTATPEQLTFVKRVAASNRKTLITELEQASRWADELSSVTTQSFTEACAKKKVLFERIRHSEDTPFVIPLLGMLGDVTTYMKKNLENQVSYSLLQTAIAVRLEGETALTSFKDPFDGKSFGYRGLPNGGFELTSRLTRMRDGKEEAVGLMVTRTNTVATNSMTTNVGTKIQDAWKLMQAGKFEDALTVFADAQGMAGGLSDETNAEILFWMGECYRDLGNTNRANAVYKNLTGKYPVTTWPDSAQKRLAEKP